MPSAPDMNATTRLATYLRKNMHKRTLGYMLTHEYTPQSLSNFGLRALKRRDRTIAGALLAASDRMSAHNPGDELVINVVRLSRTDDQESDSYLVNGLEEVEPYLLIASPTLVFIPLMYFASNTSHPCPVTDSLICAGV
jgi:hypothetical protein